MSASWSAAGVRVEPPHHLHHLPHLHHRTDRTLGVHTSRDAVLSPELCRSLHAWLGWWLGDLPDPADPDKVRVVIDEAREALRARSMEACSEDYRAGLSWCDHWLTRIGEAAGETQ